MCTYDGKDEGWLQFPLLSILGILFLSLLLKTQEAKKGFLPWTVNVL